MRYSIKIALTRIKVCYSVSFLIILALIRGISFPDEIGVAMDANVALLAIVFCADAYYQEIHENRWEVFDLLPVKNRFHTICQRLLLQVVYLGILTGLDYWVFYVHFIKYKSEANLLVLYLTAVLACTASIFFFGTLSFTFVNLFKNLWGGIGGAFLIWTILNSTVGKRIPDYINVFAYGNNQNNEICTDWIIGKLVAVITAILLIYFNKKLLVWKGKG